MGVGRYPICEFLFRFQVKLQHARLPHNVQEVNR
jgi:hypothetical protein